MSNPTTPHAGDRQHVPTDQAALELHRLKIDAQPMSDLLSGNKTCEVRNDDRGFTVGDYVHLVCADGRETDRIISHIQRGYGLPDGLCVLSYRADLAAPSAPAEVEGLTDAQKIERMADLNWKPASQYWKEQHDAKATALTAQQAENERLLGKLEEIGEFKAKEFEVLDSPWKARADKAEGELSLSKNLSDAAVKWAALDRDEDHRISMGGWSDKKQKVELAEALEELQDAAHAKLKGDV